MAEQGGDERRRASRDLAVAGATRGSAAALVRRSAALALAPRLVAALVLAQLWLAGARNVEVVATNLEAPRLSSGQRVVDLVEGAEPRARVFNVTLGFGAATADAGGRVRVQLASGGQTRILIVREGHRDASRWDAILELLRGSARLAVIADRGWLDLGALPPAHEERHVQVVGVLDGRYAFHRLVAPPPGAPPFVLDIQGWTGDRLLPPLQGADETSHAATAEGIAGRGGAYGWWWYPESIVVAATALDQERVQQQPDEPLPVRDDAERAALDRVLSSPLDRELARSTDPPFKAFGLPADARAPAFYRVFRLFGPVAPSLAIADRLALYRLTSALLALALLGAGLALLGPAASATSWAPRTARSSPFPAP